MGGWLIDKNDPAREEIVKRAMQLNITGDPDKAAHALGGITLADGRVVRAHVIHAADPIVTDGKSVVMIKRLHEPDIGKFAFPGGLLDPKKGGGVETTAETAAREAKEEANANLHNIKGVPVGKRRLNRPFDVRVAKGDGLMEKYGIADGDIFMVSTQAVRFDVASFKGMKLKAEDDAEPGSAGPVRINSIKRGMLAADHYDILVEAFPEFFAKKTPRPQKKARPGLR